MINKHRIALGSIALMLGMLFAPQGMSSASATNQDPCPGQQVNKANPWGKDVYTWITDVSGVGEGIYAHMRPAGHLVYRYCPNHPFVYAKIKPLYIKWCWTWYNRPRGLNNFDGVKFNGYVGSDNEDTNPSTFKVPDDGTPQNCRTQDINGPWMSMHNEPRWSVTGWIVKVLAHDDEFIFRTRNGSRIKWIHPRYDANVSRWY